jgi:hypothetical protein
MKIILNKARREAGMWVAAAMVALTLVIGGLGIYCLWKIASKIPNPGGSDSKGGKGGTNSPSVWELGLLPDADTNVSPSLAQSLAGVTNFQTTIEVASNLTDWLPLWYLSGVVESNSWATVTVMRADGFIVDTYDGPLQNSIVLDATAENFDPEATGLEPARFYRTTIRTNTP